MRRSATKRSTSRVRPNGTRDVLGIWIEQTKRRSFGNEMRGCGDGGILIEVVDGRLKGLAEAIQTDL